MNSFRQTVADGVGAVVAVPCEMLSTASRYLARVARSLQPGGGEPAEAGIAQVIEWLSAPARSALRDELLLKLLPPVLTAIDESGLRAFIGQRVRAHLEGVDLAPVAGGLLSVVDEKRHHQRLLDELLDGLEKLLGNDEAMEGLRRRVRGQLPALFDLYRGEPFVMRRVVASVTALVVEVRTDADHPLRVQLDEYATTLIERLRASPELASRADRLKRDLLARPELVDLTEDAWNGLRDFLVGDTRSEESKVRRHLEVIRAE